MWRRVCKSLWECLLTAAAAAINYSSARSCCPPACLQMTLMASTFGMQDQLSKRPYPSDCTVALGARLLTQIHKSCHWGSVYSGCKRYDAVSVSVCLSAVIGHVALISVVKIYFLFQTRQPCELLGTVGIAVRLVLLLLFIYLCLTAIGLTPGGSSTVHIYTQTVHRI
jgi:hypothetical protein